MKITATSFTVPDGLQVYVLIGVVRVVRTRVMSSAVPETDRETAMAELVAAARDEAIAQSNVHMSVLSDSINTDGCSAALIDIGVSSGVESDPAVSSLRVEITGKVVLCRPRADGEPIVSQQLAEGAGWMVPSEQAAPEPQPDAEDPDASYPGLYL